MPKRNEWLREPVEDWDSEKGYHGFGRADLDPTLPVEERRRYYVVKLTVMGKQCEIGRYKSQYDAAKAYDVALFRLLAFTPLCVKPNFPESFESITLSDVKTFCPYADTLYAQTRTELELKGVNVEQLIANRRKGIATPVQRALDDRQKKDRYSKMEKLLGDASVQCHSKYVHMSEGLGKLHLAKLPELGKALLAAQLALNESVKALETARASISYHKELYEHFKNDGIIVEGK